MNRNLLHIIIIAVIAAVLYSCANIGNPTGGMIDKTPPIFVRSNPMPNAVNVKDRKIELFFDEIVTLKDPSTKIIVSPAQTEMPQMNASGKKVTIELIDTLLPNTTYTIDFSNSIQDNNEGNPLENFAFAFSTGDYIDSLRVAGYVIDSRTLEPMKGIIVGMNSNHSDSAFITDKLQRVAITNDRGQFTIRNVHPGSYRLFALGDLDRDFRFGNPQEDIAFCDSLITPWVSTKEVNDTLFSADNKVDTITTRTRPDYHPNDLLLNLFNENRKSQYLANNSRIDSTRISIIFAAPSDTLPLLSIIDRKDVPTDWYTLERSLTNDTLTYWIRPSHLVSSDTLRTTLTYLRTDSLNRLSPATDTLQFTFQRPKAKKKKKNEEEDSVPKIPTMDIRSLTQQTHEIYAPLILESTTPIERFDTTAFHLQQKAEGDSVYRDVEKYAVALRDTSLNRRTIVVRHRWESGGAYRLLVDSLGVEDIYGLFSKTIKQDFSVRKMEEYGNLIFNIPEVKDSAIVELLDGQEKVVLSVPVKNHKAELINILPATYYARLYLDANGNGKYDTGCYIEHRQPETSFYYPGAIKVKKNWDIDQTWNIYDTPVDRQKPDAIKKNKPEKKKWETVTKTNPDEEDNDEGSVYDPVNPYGDGNFY